MVPPDEALPDVLPTGRLTASGRLRPEARRDLRGIPNGRNALTVIGAYAQSFGVIAVAAWLHHPVAWIAAFVLMGRAFALLLILMHEAAHRLLFSNHRANDLVGRWLLAHPGLTPFDVYRRGHMAHHKDELGPDEPDRGLYDPYPVTRASLRRKLARDLFFVSGWKNLRPLFSAMRRRSSRPVAVQIFVVQLVIAGLFTAFGRPELYLFLWLAPWLTVWRVLNRLRAIAEHGGMTRSDDRRRTTHHVRQGLLPRFWIVPYNTGWHLAHHVDIGIPFRHLPTLHRELEDAGWVTPELTSPTYRSLWRRLSSR